MIVSYKILEPELFKNQDGNASGGEFSLQKPFEDSDGVQERAGGKKPELEDNGDHHDLETADEAKEEPQQHVDVNKVVQAMATRFALNFSYTLNTSPWKLAISWATPREIHPENAKELAVLLSASFDADEIPVSPSAILDFLRYGLRPLSGPVAHKI
ncbi:glycosaminoglycan xylosylkinase-like isoform X1 [Elysia marginata]|uniref:Glycosaminoglycan xylosylkinase-like isoform X1 n=1 Tax=Elysia marginata TaxID=1093978 RepID=A0AAV4IIT2_9GAST|nr:glycosaminoglycan xylosylkinase-like isoform X1 [Elysia marginata]